MADLDHIKEIIDDALNDVENVPLEYQGTDIIIKDSLISAMFDEVLYNTEYKEPEIISKLGRPGQVIAVNDSGADQCNIRLINILNEDNFNLSVLASTLKHEYKRILETLFFLMQEARKENIINNREWDLK